MTFNRLLLGVATISVASLSPSIAPAAPGDQAGVIAAQRGGVVRVAYSASSAKRQRGVGENVTTGQKVLLGDVIVTGGKGRLQMLLLDQTMFTIGPNSRMTIDQFVYNPRTGNGKLTATVSKGFFRFISGKIAAKNPSNVKIKTRVATLSIRGTSIFGYIAPVRRAFLPGGTAAYFGLIGPGARGERPGAFTATSADGKQTVNITKPGVGFQIGANGRFGSPAPIDRATLGRLMQGVLPGTVASKGSNGGSKSGTGNPGANQGQGVIGNSGISGDVAAAGAGKAAQNLAAANVATSTTTDAAQTLSSSATGTSTFAQLFAINTGSISGTASLNLVPIQSVGSGTNIHTWTINFCARTMTLNTQVINLTTGAVPGPINAMRNPLVVNYVTRSPSASVIIGTQGGFLTFTTSGKTEFFNTSAGVARRFTTKWTINDGSGNILEGKGTATLK